jgi:selenocysteine lyase/cysteine desulfurase
MIRHTAARLVGAAPEEIAFLKNTSEGISLIAEGFPWAEGDNVAILGNDYPANVYPWLHQRPKGISVKLVQGIDGCISVEELASIVDERTRLVSVSFVHFSTGFRANLAEIGKFCRTRGIDLFVDAIQGLGVFPIDVKEMCIDYACANSQKWLLSPQGAAILFVDKRQIDKIRPTSVGWKSVVNPHEYSRVDFRLKDDASKFECGSFIIPSIVALGGSLSLIEEVGLPAISYQVKIVTDYLVDRISAVGAEVASQREGEGWSGIVSFSLPGIDSDKIVERARKAGVVISARGGCVRVSPHFYNNHDDIDRLIDVVSLQ